MKLLVIEGVGKRPAIQKYLGKDFKVFATMGHVRDLPEKTLSVDVEHNFKPTYVIMPNKKEIVSELKKSGASCRASLPCDRPGS